MKIMTVSDSPTIFTGLARVHRELLRHLSGRHELLPCCWNMHDSMVISEIKQGNSPPDKFFESNGVKTKLVAVPKANGNNCMFAVFDLIESWKPDVVISIGDYFDFWYMKAIKEKLDYQFKWLPYLTIEHDEFDKRADVYAVADRIVVPSTYGRDIVRQKWGRDSDVVPYGVSPSFNDKLREKDQGPVKFISVGQNTWRKMLPTLLRAFKKAQESCDCEFYLHTNVHAVDPQETSVFDVRSVISKLGVKRVRLPSDDQYFCIFNSPGDEYLVGEYNKADFLVSSSMCEGYGLPIVEAMACGCPLVAGGTSTHYEHVGLGFKQHGVGPRGFLAEPRLEVWPPDRMMDAADPDRLAELMVSAAKMKEKDPMTLEGMRIRCLEYARGLSWEDTGRRIEAIAQSMAEAPVTIPVEDVV